ncbi:hypothetical protein FRZ00_29415 [Streptomyces mobaraensis]|uniref:Uncharacterized protein n=1 Tax=Streptomyces mobaraensis TaxID=35621 RepID=A0A5N5W008_STRMB|nr:hypothetical protein FRZ00_29415 [Streptomyces mobaraensis]
MGCHGPHLLQGELDASRPYLGRCRLKPLDHKPGRSVSDLHPCARPHDWGIPTHQHRKASGCIVESVNTRQCWLQLIHVSRKRQAR